MAKIINYGQPIGAGTTVIPDNQVALEIESTDAEKYISLDTTDNASKVLILSTHTEADNQSSGFVGIREAAPKAPIHITGTGGSTGISINPTLSNSPCLLIENSTNNSKDRAMVLINGDGGSGGVIQLHHADTRKMILQGSSVANVRADGCTLQLDTTGTNIITFGINEAEKMRLDAAGKLSTGTTVPLGAEAGSITISTGDSTETAGHADADDLVIESDGNAGLNIISGSGSGTTNYGAVLFGRKSGVWRGGMNYQHGSSNDYLQFWTAGTAAVKIDKDNNVGISTTAPGQILDVNQGSGNMIADGYDTHSLAAYKENLGVADTGYLAKAAACPPKQWTGTPYVSAEEIKVATIDEFGQDAWSAYFPDKTSHRAGALKEMPAGEMKTWIDAWADARRAERRQDDKWQQLRLGLVADADDTAANFSEAIARNHGGEISGINTMSYIGILHAALIELAAKVEELENGE